MINVQNQPRTGQFIRHAGNGLLVFVVVGAVVFAFLQGMAKQQEIDAQKTSDYCRAYPRACDIVAQSAR